MYEIKLESESVSGGIQCVSDNNRMPDGGLAASLCQDIGSAGDAGLPIYGGRGSSAVERATPGEEVPGSIPAGAARVCIM